MQSLSPELKAKAQIFKRMHDPAMPEERWHPADEVSAADHPPLPISLIPCPLSFSPFLSCFRFRILRDLQPAPHGRRLPRQPHNPARRHPQHLRNPHSIHPPTLHNPCIPRTAPAHGPAIPPRRNPAPLERDLFLLDRRLRRRRPVLLPCPESRAVSRV